MSGDGDAVARNAWLLLFKTRRFVIRHEDELEKVLQHAGANPTKKYVQSLMKENSACITYLKFKAIIQSLFMNCDSETIAADSRQRLTRIFKSLDVNGDGYLSRQELTSMLTKRGEAMSLEEVAKIFSLADKNNDGRLDFDEFCSIFETTTKQCHHMAKIQQMKREKKKAKIKEEVDLRRRDEETRQMFLEEVARQRQTLEDERRKIDEDRQRLQDEISTLAKLKATSTIDEKPRSPQKPDEDDTTEPKDAVLSSTPLPPDTTTPSQSKSQSPVATFKEQNLQSVRPSRTVVGVTDKTWKLPMAELTKHDLLASSSDTNLLRFQPHPPEGQPPAYLRGFRRHSAASVKSARKPTPLVADKPSDEGNAEEEARVAVTEADTKDPIALETTFAKHVAEGEQESLETVVDDSPTSCDRVPAEVTSHADDDDNEESIIDETTEAGDAAVDETFNSKHADVPDDGEKKEVTVDDTPSALSAQDLATETEAVQDESPIINMEKKDDSADSPPGEPRQPEPNKEETSAKENQTDTSAEVQAVPAPLEQPDEHPEEKGPSSPADAALEEPLQEVEETGESEEPVVPPAVEPTAESQAGENCEDVDEQPAATLSKVTVASGDASAEDDASDGDVEDLVSQLHDALGKDDGDEDEEEGSDAEADGSSGVVFGEELDVMGALAQSSNNPPLEELVAEEKPSDPGDETKEEDAKPPVEESQAETSEESPENISEEKEDHHIRQLSASEAPGETDLKDWHCLAFKGCMFANDPHDISTHQFEVSITAETKMFATLKLKGPSKPIDVGFVLARVEDTEATGSSSVLEAAVSDGDGENEVRLVASVDPGDYIFAPFTTCAKLAAIVKSDSAIRTDDDADEGAAKNGTLLGDDGDMLPKVRAAFEEIFHRHDLNDSGGLDQEEFILLHTRCGEDSLDAEDWQVVKDSFETSEDGELTLEGFLHLQAAVVKEVAEDGDSLETWRILDAMGYNQRVELTKAWPFACEVNLDGDEDASVSIHELTSDPTVADDSLTMVAMKRGAPVPVHGGSDGGNESSVDVRTLSWGRGYATIVAQNKGSDSVTLECDCSQCLNSISHRGRLTSTDVLVAMESKVLHHIVPEDDEKDFKPACTVSIKKE